VPLHDLLEGVVALMDHHHARDVAVFLEIRGRALDVGEHHGDRAPEFLQLRQQLRVAARGLDDLRDAVLRHSVPTTPRGKACCWLSDKQPARPCGPPQSSAGARLSLWCMAERAQLLLREAAGVDK